MFSHHRYYRTSLHPVFLMDHGTLIACSFFTHFLLRYCLHITGLYAWHVAYFEFFMYPQISHHLPNM